MAGRTLNVPIEELIRKSNAFQALLSEMQGRLNGLDSFMEDRIKSWDGASKAAYATLNAEWRAGAMQLNRVGQDFATAILASSKKFSQAEQNNLEAIARTRRQFT